MPLLLWRMPPPGVAAPDLRAEGVPRVVSRSCSPAGIGSTASRICWSAAGVARHRPNRANPYWQGPGQRSGGCLWQRRERDSNPRGVASQGFSRAGPVVASVGSHGSDLVFCRAHGCVVGCSRPSSAGDHGQTYGKAAAAGPPAQQRLHMVSAVTWAGSTLSSSIVSPDVLRPLCPLRRRATDGRWRSGRGHASSAPKCAGISHATEPCVGRCRLGVGTGRPARTSSTPAGRHERPGVERRPVGGKGPHH